MLLFIFFVFWEFNIGQRLNTWVFIQTRHTTLSSFAHQWGYNIHQGGYNAYFTSPRTDA